MSKLRANQLTDKASTGAPTAPNGLVVTGVTTSTSFSGSGANLTSLPSAQLTGAVPVTKGGTGLTSIGAANKALKVNSAGNALEYGDAGAWTKITSGTGPNSAVTAVGIDNIFSDTYDFYKVFLSWRQDDWMKLRFITTAGPTQTSSDYVWVLNAVRENGSGDFGPSREGGHGNNYAAVTWWDATDSGTSYLELSFHHPYSSSTRTGFSHFSHYNQGGNGSLATIGGGMYNATESHKGLTIFGGSGDLISDTNFDYLVLGAKL